ncbi:hypothetical protein D3C77_605960 [compost metagenome]
MQQDQDVADFLDPVLGFVGGQKAFLGGTGDLVVHAFEQEAYILGPGFGLNRRRRVVHRQRFTLGDQAFKFSNACTDAAAVLVQGQLALVEVEFKAGQQQLQGWSHQLAGEGLGDLATTTQAVGQFNLQPGTLELVVLDYVVEVADHNQQRDPRYYKQGDHKWCHR